MDKLIHEDNFLIYIGKKSNIGIKYSTFKNIKGCRYHIYIYIKLMY